MSGFYSWTNKLWQNMTSTRTTKFCFKMLKFCPPNQDVWTAFLRRSSTRWTSNRINALVLSKSWKSIPQTLKDNSSSPPSSLIPSYAHAPVPALRYAIPFPPIWPVFLCGYTPSLECGPIPTPPLSLYRSSPSPH